MVQNRNIEMEIILTLLRSKSHLREIGREIKESHSTVLRKINGLVKEGILDYKKEGKNKIFFIRNNLRAKNHVYAAEIYKLSKLISKHSELSIIFEDIKKTIVTGMIVLFGSYAKGIEKRESDIDIYIETKNNNVKSKVKELNSRLNPKIGVFDANSLLIREILKNHVVIRGVEEFYEKSKFFEQT